MVQEGVSVLWATHLIDEVMQEDHIVVLHHRTGSHARHSRTYHRGSGCSRYPLSLHSADTDNGSLARELMSAEVMGYRGPTGFTAPQYATSKASFGGKLCASCISASASSRRARAPAGLALHLCCRLPAGPRFLHHTSL